MVKSKQRSLEADILVRQLKDKYIYKSYFYENKFLAFVEKSIDELIDSYLAGFKDRALHSSFNELYSKALKSCDKILLEVALEKAEALNEKYMAASLLGCIASSKSNDNIAEALEIASSITFQDLKESALYDIAKNIYAQDLQKAVAIISALPTRAQYGFRAFLSSSNKDLRDIISSIKEIDTLHKTHFMSDNDYSDCLLKIAYSIIGNYPHLACNLLEKLNNFWGEEIYIEIQIQIEIAIAFSKNDLEEGISYLLTIDIDCYQIFIITELIESIDDVAALTRLSKLSEHYVDASLQYDILSAVHKKMAVPFQQLWGVTSKILPYAY